MGRLSIVCGIAAVLVASSVIAQPQGQDRVRELEKQMETMRKQMEAMGQRLDKLKKQEAIQQRIDELQRRIEGAERVAQPEMTAGYKKKFYIKSADDLFQINIGGRLHADWWSYEGGHIEPWGGADFSNTFFLRRARINTTGHLWGKAHKFKVQADFTEGGGQEIRDGWMELAYVPWLKIRFGQFKVPFAREYVQSALYIQFPERSLAVDNLSHGRDVGIMAHGDLFDGRLTYATAIINGAGAGRGDDNDEYDWVYRLVAKPFRKSGNPWLEGFEIGHNLQTGNQPLGRGIRGRTAGDVDYYNPGTIAGVLPQVLRHGTRTRVGVDGAWYIGPFSLTWEYLHVDEHRHDVNQYGRRSLGSIEHNGWYVTTSYLLTGEKKGPKSIKPKNNFDPLKGGWGAWEVAARIGQSEHQSRDVLFTHTYTDVWGNVRVQPFKHVQDTAFTFGVNWYLNYNTIIKFAWIHDMFDERLMSPEHDIDTFQTRFQIFW